MNLKNNLSFKITKSNHLSVPLKINLIDYVFLIDTGASNSCINNTLSHLFNPLKEHNILQVTGAFNDSLSTKIVCKTLSISNITLKNFELIAINLSHINQALKKHKCNPIDGVLGNNFLSLVSATICFKTNKIFFL